MLECVDYGVNNNFQNWKNRGGGDGYDVIFILICGHTITILLEKSQVANKETLFELMMSSPTLNIILHFNHKIISIHSHLNKLTQIFFPLILS